MSTLIYLKNLVRDYRIASVTPTSAFGVRWICRQIDFERARVIVEFGPATGVITEKLLERMRPDAKLILIELNENFVKILRKKFRDPRVSIHHEDARNVREVVASEGHEGIDALITGIPFSYLPDEVREKIVGETARLMREGGKFVAYQTIWQQDRHLLDHLARHFDHTVGTIELRNAPPLRLYQARKALRANGHHAANGRSHAS
jgi:phospholipid N-methyltransferase